jgi:hypothetical protein
VRRQIVRDVGASEEVEAEWDLVAVDLTIVVFVYLPPELAERWERYRFECIGGSSEGVHVDHISGHNGS